MGLAIAFDFLFRMVRSRMIDVTGKTVDVVLAANIFEHVMAVETGATLTEFRSASLPINFETSIRRGNSSLPASAWFQRQPICSLRSFFVGVLFIIAMGPWRGFR